MEPIVILIDEKDGLIRRREPVSLGIPLPKSVCTDTRYLTLKEDGGGIVPCQAQRLASWPDRSLKWVLLDFQASIAAFAQKKYRLRLSSRKDAVSESSGIRIETAENSLSVNTGSAVFHIDKKVFRPFERVINGEAEYQESAGCGSRTWLVDGENVSYLPVIQRFVEETSGSLRSTLLCRGRMISDAGKFFADFNSRLTFYAGHSDVRMDFCLHNPRAAEHPGGLWDLGDPGSVFFKEMTTAIQSPKDDNAEFRLKTAPGAELFRYPLNPQNDLFIYQESSGGENWAHRNHTNRFCEVPMEFCGYRIFKNGIVKSDGKRAEPLVSIRKGGFEVQAAISGFWQNFPKAIGHVGGELAVSLFPGQYPDLYELQGGERKTHSVFMKFESEASEAVPADAWLRPLVPVVDPMAFVHAKVFPYLSDSACKSDATIEGMIQIAVEGSHSFLQRREIIDEYGWRNYGDLFADHESALTDSDAPLVSHYNNQYDCLFGMLVQFMRTADPRWFQLSDALCAHLCDIDIYHTGKDRPEFNGGLFWHTEHYIDAETATHRCFSRRHADKRNLATYGGGPSLSHVYTRGLLIHHWLTGSPVSREALLKLANYVLANIRINNTLCNRTVTSIRRSRARLKGLIQGNNLVQMTKVYGLDGPGRSSGNSLNALLDAFRLTEERKYLLAAEGLIRQCIGPEDDMESRDLLDVENRWMYTVFLQALGSYLDVKREWGEHDDNYTYARETLLKYASWMVDNEKSFLSDPDKLEYPNETWAAQELRKACILSVAANYAQDSDQEKLLKASELFFRNAVEDLQSFETRTLTRPTAIVLQNYLHLLSIDRKVSSHDTYQNWIEPQPTADQAAKNGLFSNFSLSAEKQFIYWRLPKGIRNKLSRLMSY